MGNFFIPTTGPEDWKGLLAEPEKHWRTGFSAKAIANCWEEAGGFPTEIDRLFSTSGFFSFQGIELLIAFPEYQVTLPGGPRPSQNDLFVLAKAQGQLIAIMVEGKVSEPFGPTLREWSATKSEGRSRRLAFLTDQLGLPQKLPSHIRYQLLHRTVSSIIEAKRFNAKSAVMIVHSFSQDNQWVEDFRAFLGLFDVMATPDRLFFVKETKGVNLYSGWAKGEKKYLEA